ncbi:Acriflavine sensitivity control protein [Penicillium ucsense]|uniref:Acriflavine sensitivity control protein n=1 Tax=Penicillium ucsense TaxID=2839758 RepID=A0A8J8W9S3_9EURO|nr:Acriflavine sensitivity control protein [Penicillium ucsense]KAF7733847.1 Acriflavine sensitivity control protein [Penicillium ucsense]
MNKGCYTCRRRRIICDNGQPTCRKCRDAGKECLGYQKPLVWVKGGVASRGKMMGRSFEDVKKPEGNIEARKVGRDYTPTASNTGGGFGFITIAEASSSSANSSPSSGIYTSPESDAYAQELTEDNMGHSTTVHSGPSELASSGNTDNRLVHLPGNGSFSSYNPAPWGLIDPLLKDMSQASRFYIHHYNQNMAHDFVVYRQSKNPWRNIIPLVGESPLLAHALCAMSAVHYSLMLDSDSSQMPWSSNNPLTRKGTPLSPNDLQALVFPASQRRSSSQAFQHFLEFKQRTLHQLSKDLRNPVMQRDDRTLAAIVVLALVDVFESGSGAWSYHIEGAKKLLRDRPENHPGQRILDDLETFAIDGCLIMEIMGSTLARPGALSKPFFSAAMGPAMLKRLEETSWVGCPAYLLEVIFFIHTLWYSDSEATLATPQPTALSASMHPGQPLTLDSYLALLQGIRDFDPVAWAYHMQSSHFLPDLSTRIALGKSYQNAVYLYTSRVLNRARAGYTPPWADVGLPADHAATASALLEHICSVPHSDPHFKCLIWPTFIAGAECRRPSQRPLILEKLGALYHTVTSVNVQNAAWVLRLMWEKHDQRREPKSDMSSYTDTTTEPGETLDALPGHSRAETCDECDDTFDWVDELDESRLDWLFI